MNIPKTDISRISQSIGSRPAEAAYPSNLDDVILHQIARDFRLVELSATHNDGMKPELSAPQNDSMKPSLAGAMYLICHILLDRTKTLVGDAAVQISEERLWRWLEQYMYYIEREVVSRAINMPNPHDTDLLISEIKSDILAAQ